MRRTRHLMVALLAVLLVSMLASPVDAAIRSHGPIQREAPGTASGPVVTGGEGSSNPIVEVLYNAADLWVAPYSLVRCFRMIW